MNFLSTLKSLVIAAVVSSTMTSVAQADTSATIMVTINHKVPSIEVSNYLRALQRTDTSLGMCFFNVKLVDFVEDTQDFTSTYYGTAILQVEERCAREKMRAYFQELFFLQKKGFYTLFSNPIIDALPGISGRN